jgi:hypothetical protein
MVSKIMCKWPGSAVTRRANVTGGDDRDGTGMCEVSLPTELGACLSHALAGGAAGGQAVRIGNRADAPALRGTAMMRLQQSDAQYLWAECWPRQA